MANDGGGGISDGFSDWAPLTPAGLAAAPDAPGAVQLGRADRSLVAYPRGKSAMVFWFYAERSMRQALARLFRDELEEPGARGEGALVFRCLPGGAPARAHLERLYDDFIERFGRAPILHPDDDDDDGDDDDDDDDDGTASEHSR